MLPLTRGQAQEMRKVEYRGLSLAHVYVSGAISSLD